MLIAALIFPQLVARPSSSSWHRLANNYRSTSLWFSCHISRHAAPLPARLLGHLKVTTLTETSGVPSAWHSAQWVRRWLYRLLHLPPLIRHSPALDESENIRTIPNVPVTRLQEPCRWSRQCQSCPRTVASDHPATRVRRMSSIHSLRITWS